MLGALRRAGELERLELEVRDRAKSRCDRDLERRRRGDAGADRQRRVDGSLDSDRRPTQRRELRLDCADEPSPVGLVARSRERVRREQRSLCRDAVDANAEIERDGQHEPAGQVGVLADQVDAPRSPERARAQSATPTTPP